MSSINKQSLREEFETLKTQFTRLCSDGKMSPESRSLFQAMLMLFELLMAVFMERYTTKDSKNSSKPSSQTAKDDTAESHPGSKGKGKEQNNVRCGNTRTVETVQIAEVHVCETCGEDLAKKPPVSGMKDARRSILSSKKWFATWMSRLRNAPTVRHAQRGVFQPTCPVPLQYGTGVKAYVLNMIIAQMVSFKRVQQSIKTLIGQLISEATMLKYILQLHYCLEHWEHGAVEELLAMPAMHADETSLRVEKKKLLDTCLFRRRYHLEIPPSQAGRRGDRGHRRHPTLWRSRYS